MFSLDIEPYNTNDLNKLIPANNQFHANQTTITVKLSHSPRVLIKLSLLAKMTLFSIVTIPPNITHKEKFLSGKCKWLCEN